MKSGEQIPGFHGACPEPPSTTLKAGFAKLRINSVEGFPPGYGSTEGFDTADLQEAKALLEELAQIEIDR